MSHARRILILLGLGLALFAPARARQLVARPALAHSEGMISISGGEYSPLYRSPGESAGVVVPPFLIDPTPVTNGQFLLFVEENPDWRRSRIPGLFADRGYLRHWRSDTVLGLARTEQPVTNISWFAARAYARWLGNRLPSTAEWEYVARASDRAVDGYSQPGFAKKLLEVTTQPTPDVLPDVGVSIPNIWGAHDMHGLVWEWVSDFNSALTTGESRGDSNLERKLFCGAGVIGASDFTDYAAFMRFSFRGSLTARYVGSNLGFRTVRSIVPPES